MANAQMTRINGHADSRSGWLKGELLELAILHTLRRHSRPLDWLEIVHKGVLDHRSTSADRLAAIESLIARGDVITELAPKPHAFWEKIAIYSVPPAAEKEVS